MYLNMCHLCSSVCFQIFNGNFECNFDVIKTPADQELFVALFFTFKRRPPTAHSLSLCSLHKAHNSFSLCSLFSMLYKLLFSFFLLCFYSILLIVRISLDFSTRTGTLMVLTGWRLPQCLYVDGQWRRDFSTWPQHLTDGRNDCVSLLFAVQCSLFSLFCFALDFPRIKFTKVF